MQSRKQNAVCTLRNRLWLWKYRSGSTADNPMSRFKYSTIRIDYLCYARTERLSTRKESDDDIRCLGFHQDQLLLVKLGKCSIRVAFAPAQVCSTISVWESKVVRATSRPTFFASSIRSRETLVLGGAHRKAALVKDFVRGRELEIRPGFRVQSASKVVSRKGKTVPLWRVANDENHT